MKIVEVSVPEETKNKMKKIPEDWSNYLRLAIEARIVHEKNKMVLEELKKLWKQMPKTPKCCARRSVREDRDRV